MQINVASGNALIRTRDLSDSLLNYHVVVDRAYNSLASDTFSILSPRWGFDVGPATHVAVQGNGDALVTGPSGYKLRFVKQTDGTFTAPADFDGSLVKTASGWTLNRTSQGDQFGFDNSGTLTWTKDAAVRDFTVQGTSAAGRDVLSSYGTSSGRRVNLSYTGDSLVREMDDPSSGHHYYRYTAGRLTTYESPSGQITSYRYDGNGLLDKITEPGGTTVELDVAPSGRVRSITTTLPGGFPQTTSFVYTRRTYKSDVTGPDSVRRTYAYDDDWRVTRQYNPDVVPTVTPSSELKDLQDGYVGPHRTYLLTVAAGQPDGAGLRRLAVEHGDGTELAGADVPCVTTPFDLVCPTAYSSSFDLDFANDPEGERTLRTSARDDEQHYETSPVWSVWLDKTGPQTITEFAAANVDVNGNSTLSWTPAADPALAGGHPGSGTKEYAVRYRINGGAWSAPVTTTQPAGTASGLAGGDAVNIEVTAIDHVGNATTSESEAIVVGPEPPDPCGAVPTPDFCLDPPDDVPIDAESDPDDVELAPLPAGVGERSLPASIYRIQSSNSDCRSGDCWTTVRNQPKSWVVGNLRTVWSGEPFSGEGLRSLVRMVGTERGYHYGEMTWLETAAQKNCAWLLAGPTSGNQGGTTADCPSGSTNQKVDYSKFHAKPYGGRINGGLVRGNNCYRANGQWLPFGTVCDEASPMRLERSSELCANVFTTLSQGHTRNECRAKDQLGTLAAGRCVQWRYVTFDRRWVMVRMPGRDIRDGAWAFVRARALPADRSTWPGLYQDHCN